MIQRDLVREEEPTAFLIPFDALYEIRGMGKNKNFVCKICGALRRDKDNLKAHIFAQHAVGYERKRR